MKISIIVPYYNVKKELFITCIDSILHQDYDDYELIVVNDGSDKKYHGVLAEAEKRDRRISVIHQPNSGVSSARNHGIQAANGEFILFADADDSLTPQSLKEAVEIQKKTDADLVMGAVERTHLYTKADCGKSVEMQVLSGNEKERIKPYFIGGVPYRFSGGGYLGKGPWCRLIRSSIVKETMFDVTLTQGEDIVWNLQILDKCRNVCLVDRVWYLYYDNPLSATSRYNDRIYPEVTKEMNCIRPLVNFDEDAEFAAFCDKMLDELKKVSACFLNHPECRQEKAERKKLLEEIYTKEPWSLIASQRYRKLTRRNNRIKVFLYKARLLMSFYGIMK